MGDIQDLFRYLGEADDLTVGLVLSAILCCACFCVSLCCVGYRMYPFFRRIEFRNGRRDDSHHETHDTDDSVQPDPKKQDIQEVVSTALGDINAINSLLSTTVQPMIYPQCIPVVACSPCHSPNLVQNEHQSYSPRLVPFCTFQACHPCLGFGGNHSQIPIQHPAYQRRKRSVFERIRKIVPEALPEVSEVTMTDMLREFPENKRRQVLDKYLESTYLEEPRARQTSYLPTPQTSDYQADVDTSSQVGCPVKTPRQKLSLSNKSSSDRSDQPIKTTNDASGASVSKMNAQLTNSLNDMTLAVQEVKHHVESVESERKSEEMRLRLERI